MYLAQSRSVGSSGGYRRNRGEDLGSRSPKGHNKWLTILGFFGGRNSLEAGYRIKRRASGLWPSVWGKGHLPTYFRGLELLDVKEFEKLRTFNKCKEFLANSFLCLALTAFSMEARITLLYALTDFIPPLWPGETNYPWNRWSWREIALIPPGGKKKSVTVVQASVGKDWNES